MAISINWSTKIITVPQADLTAMGGGVYQLDVDAFRLALKNIEDSEEGSVFPDTHRHSTQVTLSGVTYARTFEVINGYTVTFQDTGTPYTVLCVGANHNLADVKNVNQVSLIIGNAAGLISVTSGSGLSVEQTQQLLDLHRAHFNKRDVAANVIRVYADDGVTVLHEFDTDAEFTHVTPVP